MSGGPIFIVGCAHSGTTLLARVLDHHPDMVCLKWETGLFATQKPLPRWKDLVKFHDGTRVVEKTPRHAHFIGKILEVLPDARIVFMVRDGRDVACSFRNKGDDVMKACERWVCDNQFLFGWGDDDRVRRLDYEALVSETEKTMRGLLGWLGEEYHDLTDFWQYPVDWLKCGIADREPNQKENNAKKYRNWQINKPIGYENRTGLWKSDPLDDRCLGVLNPMLKQLGYLP